MLNFGEWQMYCEQGGIGSAVVYVHGGFPCLLTELRKTDYGGWTWTWESQFARQFHFIWYDRRGCYRSSAPDHGYDFGTQAADIEKMMDSLGVDSAHIIGSSAGGPISIVFAAMYPTHIKSLTLVGTALRLFPANDLATKTIEHYGELVQQHGQSALIESRPTKVVASFDALWEEPEHAARGELEKYQAEQLELDSRAVEVDPDVRRRYYQIELEAIQAYLKTDVADYARQVQCPAFVIHGTEDRMVPPDWSKSLARTIPNCERKTIDGGNHGLLIRSDDARRRVADFIQRFDMRS
jgi:pimeloyl-ACP methyl ester carboxylesterase